MAEQVDREEMDRVVGELFSDAVIALHQGSSPDTVKGSMIGRGVNPDIASAIIEKAVAFRRPASNREANGSDSSPVMHSSRSESASGDMLVGGSICLVGILITTASYDSATGGGTYVVAWGAILFGAIKFLKGVAGI
jgi:hypothetical protein